MTRTRSSNQPFSVLVGILIGLALPIVCPSYGHATDIVFSTSSGGVGRRGTVNCDSGPGSSLGQGVVVSLDNQYILLAEHNGAGSASVARFNAGTCVATVEPLVPAGSCTNFTQPWGATIDGAGRLNVVSISSTATSPGGCTSLGQLFRFNSSTGACLDTIPDEPTIASPLGVAVAPSGDVYIGQPGPPSCGFDFGFFRFASDGTALSPAFVSTTAAPWDATFGPDGKLYWAHNDGGIWRGAPGGPFYSFVTSGFVQGFAFNPDTGNIFAAIGGDIYEFSGVDGSQVGDGPAFSGVDARFVAFFRPAAVPSPAHLFVGLKNSDDQGTKFDVQVELQKNGNVVATGLTRCIVGVTRAPSSAKEVIVAFDPVPPIAVASGDVLSLRISTRIGTNPDGTKCTGPGSSHNSATGLRLYYDSATRPSRFDLTSGSSSTDLFLDSDGGACLNSPSVGVTSRTLSEVAPTGSQPKCQDSGAVSIAGGNPFQQIATWGMTLP